MDGIVIKRSIWDIKEGIPVAFSLNSIPEKGKTQSQLVRSTPPCSLPTSTAASFLLRSLLSNQSCWFLDRYFFSFMRSIIVPSRLGKGLMYLTSSHRSRALPSMKKSGTPPAYVSLTFQTKVSDTGRNLRANARE